MSRGNLSKFGVGEIPIFGSTVYWFTIVVIVVQDSISLKHTLKFQITMGKTTLTFLLRLLLSMLPEAFTGNFF